MTASTEPGLVASRRNFIAGAMAMGLSATAATRLAAIAQTDGDQVDFNALGNDRVSGTFPLTEDTVTFHVLIPSNAAVDSFELTGNAFTRWYEERTNVHIEWEVVPAEDAQTELNVRLVSGAYPDVLMSFDPSPPLQQLYGSLGIFIPLNDSIDQHAVEFNRVVEQYPRLLDTITAADGAIYSLPHINDCIHCAQDRKLFIYQPWLDALGLEMPTTTEAFHTVLQAFKEQDPGANERAAVFPLATCIDGWNSELDLTLMNSFVFNPGEPYLFNQDSVVTASYLTEGWKQGTRYMAALFAEGLIDPDSFTQTTEQLIAKTSPDGPTRVGAAVGGSWEVFVEYDANDPAARWSEYTLAPALAGPEGVQISAWNPYWPFASGNFIVTENCANPEIAFRWADGLYDLETSMRSVYGPPGANWRWANEGETGIDGQPAIWARLPVEDDDEAVRVGWSETGPSFRSSRLRLGESLENLDLRATNLDLLTEEVLAPFRQPPQWWLPPMYFNQDQAAVVAKIQATLIPFVKESLVRWITGEGNIDDEWEVYLGELDAIGVQPYLDAHQSTFEAQRGSSIGGHKTLHYPVDQGSAG